MANVLYWRRHPHFRGRIISFPGRSGTGSHIEHYVMNLQYVLAIRPGSRSIGKRRSS
jgi:hypothetical protein